MPADSVANTVASLGELTVAGFEVEALDVVVNCPVVPAGSTALLRGAGESAILHKGWSRGMRISYFSFEERALKLDDPGAVPTSPSFVAFQVNPDDEGGGPSSGFASVAGSAQPHHVVGTLPTAESHAPLWSVNATTTPRSTSSWTSRAPRSRRRVTQVKQPRGLPTERCAARPRPTSAKHECRCRVCPELGTRP